jgi:hypothetical protein
MSELGLSNTRNADKPKDKQWNDRYAAMRPSGGIGANLLSNDLKRTAH